MSEKALVSIIIPAYNSGATIRRAIKSALGQSYANIEVIVIDDGSSDGTQTIVNDIAVSDPRLRVISKPNGGVSAARNDGIAAAQGEWFLTLDADDYYDPGMVEALCLAAETTDADTIMCGFRYIYGNGRRETFKVSEDYTDDKESFIDNMMAELYDQHMISWHANQIYKTEIARKNRVLYNESIAVNEDIDFVLRYLKHCGTIGVIKGVYLNYVQHAGAGKSLINTFRPYGIASALLVLRDCNELFEDIHAGVRTIDQMNQRMFLHICSFAGLMYYMSGYSEKRRLAELEELCSKEDFDDLLMDMRPRGIKARTAHLLLRLGDVKAYDRLCRLLYGAKAAGKDIEPVPDPGSGDELAAACREPYIRLGIYTDVFGQDTELAADAASAVPGLSAALGSSAASASSAALGSSAVPGSSAVLGSSAVPGSSADKRPEDRILLGEDGDSTVAFVAANIDTDVIMAALEKSADDSAAVLEQDDEESQAVEDEAAADTHVTMEDLKRVRELLSL